MSVFINRQTRYIIQGITGKEGRRAAAFMAAAGSQVVAGVRPGKGGQLVDAVPVYDTVQQAVQSVDTENLVSVVVVPPVAVKQAVGEAIDAGIRFVVAIAEGVPMLDTAFMIAYARKHGARLLGPNTVGLISPGQSKAGVIGGSDNRAYTVGPVGIISKSGGMTGETARLLTRAGIGQSTCVNIGGDKLVGTDIVDCLEAFAQDKDTTLVVLFGEIGGRAEEQAAEWIMRTGFNKPVVAFISGASAQRWQSVPLGHAGAIIEGTTGTRDSKVRALLGAGVHVVQIHHQIVDKVQTLLK